LESGHRKQLLGMPLFAQVLAVLVSAGEDVAARAALWSTECSHRPVLLQCPAEPAGSLGDLTPPITTGSHTNPPTDRDNLQPG
jgi:hypothetical protein